VTMYGSWASGKQHRSGPRRLLCRSTMACRVPNLSAFLVRTTCGWVALSQLMTGDVNAHGKRLCSAAPVTDVRVPEADNEVEVWEFKQVQRHVQHPLEWLNPPAIGSVLRQSCMSPA